MCIPAAPAGWSSRRAGHDRPARPMTATLVPVRFEPHRPGAATHWEISPDRCGGWAYLWATRAQRPTHAQLGEDDRHPRLPRHREKKTCRPQHPRTTVRAAAELERALVVCAGLREPGTLLGRAAPARDRRCERARQIVRRGPVIRQVGRRPPHDHRRAQGAPRARRRTPRAAGCARLGAAPRTPPRAAAHAGTRRCLRPPGPAGDARLPRATPRRAASQTVAGRRHQPLAHAPAADGDHPHHLLRRSAASLDAHDQDVAAASAATRAERLRSEWLASSSAKKALPSERSNSASTRVRSGLAPITPCRCCSQLGAVERTQVEPASSGGRDRARPGKDAAGAPGGAHPSGRWPPTRSAPHGSCAPGRRAGRASSDPTSGDPQGRAPTGRSAVIRPSHPGRARTGVPGSTRRSRPPAWRPARKLGQQLGELHTARHQQRCRGPRRPGRGRGLAAPRRTGRAAALPPRRRRSHRSGPSRRRAVARARNSSASRLFPTPASPPITNTSGRPSAAAASPSSNRRSSFSRPTKRRIDHGGTMRLLRLYSAAIPGSSWDTDPRGERPAGPTGMACGRSGRRGLRMGVVSLHGLPLCAVGDLRGSHSRAAFGTSTPSGPRLLPRSGSSRCPRRVRPPPATSMSCGPALPRSSRGDCRNPQRLSWDADRIADHQRQRLRAQLAHAVERSSFHARRLKGIDADRFEVADLEELPVMTKAEMMASFDQFVTDRRLGRRVVEERLSPVRRRAGLLWIPASVSSRADARDCEACRADHQRIHRVRRVDQPAGDSEDNSRQEPPAEGRAVVWWPPPRRCTRPASELRRRAAGPAHVRRPRRSRWPARSPSRRRPAARGDGLRHDLGATRPRQQAGRLRIAPASVTATAELLQHHKTARDPGRVRRTQ